MGGAVSSGESNDDLVDNLVDANYIKNAKTESVFRAVDRGFYFTKEHRASAYKDLAWKDGRLHISAPCIYTEVIENIRIKPGMSFLNIGSGTGYFSTVVGLMLGRTGINHGIEIHGDVVEYARAKLMAFIHSSPAIDLFDFAPPEFSIGNIFEVLPGTTNGYDRIYCGAACQKEEAQFIVNLLKVGGISIIPLNDTLLQITRSSESKLEMKTLLSVSFASLLPANTDIVPKKMSSLPNWTAKGLKELCRAEIRDICRRTLPVQPHASESRQRKVFRRKAQRRTNRLLLMQRRRREIRHRAGDRRHELNLIELSRDAIVPSSSDDDESVRHRSPSGTSNILDPDFSSEEEADTHVESETINDSGTESGEHQHNQSLPYIEVTQDTVVNGEEGRGQGPLGGSPTPGCSNQEPRNSSGGATVSRAGPQCRSRSFHDQPPRCPRTIRILERIREIIRRRQLERQSHLPTGTGTDFNTDYDELTAAIIDPERNDPTGYEAQMDLDGLWSTSEEDTSSSSSDLESGDGRGEVAAVMPENEENSEQIEISSLGQNCRPLRRFRGSTSTIDTTDDSDSDANSIDMQLELPVIPHEMAVVPPTPLAQTADGRSNIDNEIDVIHEELSVKVPLTNAMSIALLKKINLLSLPPSMKSYLNYGRDVVESKGESMNTEKI